MKTHLSIGQFLIVLTCLGYLMPAVANADMAGSERAMSEDAGNCAAEDTLRFRGGTFRLENDLFTGTDQNYTSGIGFTRASHDIPGELQVECLPTPIRLHAQLIQWMNPDFWTDADNQSLCMYIELSLNSLHTPFIKELYRLFSIFTAVLTVAKA